MAEDDDQPTVQDAVHEWYGLILVIVIGGSLLLAIAWLGDVKTSLSTPPTSGTPAN